MATGNGFPLTAMALASGRAFRILPLNVGALLAFATLYAIRTMVPPDCFQPGSVRLEGLAPSVTVLSGQYIYYLCYNRSQ